MSRWRYCPLRPLSQRLLQLKIAGVNETAQDSLGT
jgi:hypothetical protein